jgi:hypothetical protein
MKISAGVSVIAAAGQEQDLHPESHETQSPDARTEGQEKL